MPNKIILYSLAVYMDMNVFIRRICLTPSDQQYVYM